MLTGVDPSARSGLSVEWGFNDWVAVSDANASHQAQIGSPLELADLIRRFGVREEEALHLATRYWRERPSDASALMARPRQSMFAATGLPARTVLAAVAVVVLFYVYFVVYHA